MNNEATKEELEEDIFNTLKRQPLTRAMLLQGRVNQTTEFSGWTNEEIRKEFIKTYGIGTPIYSRLNNKGEE